MKILCVADHVDPLVYSTSIKERFGDVDVVLRASDLPMEYLGFIASSLNKPVVFIFGNHNLKEFDNFRRHPSPMAEYGSIKNGMRNSFGSTHAGDRVVNVNGLLIAGLGGSMCYNHGPNQFTERQMYQRMVRLLPRLWWNRLMHGRYVDILLTHTAPKGIGDRADLCHVGFDAFLWFMRRFKPRYLLHGHIHLYDLNANRTTTFGSTQVINVYDHYLLQWEGSNA